VPHKGRTQAEDVLVEVTGDEEIVFTGDFMTCSAHQILICDQSKTDRMGKAGYTCGGGDMCAKYFGRTA
jgi:hypothetical protein